MLTQRLMSTDYSVGFEKIRSGRGRRVGQKKNFEVANIPDG
jgi:hypothetical protein